MFSFRKRSNTKAVGKPDRTAFSLLEVIVAMSLGMVLLASVWMMFNLLGKRQEISMRDSDRNQITRSLHQQLTRDLMNLTAVEVAGSYATRTTQPNTQFRPGPSRFPVPIRNATSIHTTEPLVALQGDSMSLTLEVFVDPNEANRLRATNSVTRSPADAGTIEGPATKRVVYEMGNLEIASPEQPTSTRSRVATDLQGNESEEATVPRGLVRYEAIRQYGSLGTGSESQQQPADSLEDTNWEGLPFAMPSVSPRQEVLLREHVADIVSLRFSYFDGQTWFSSWHSQDRKSLPLAVRAEFRFASKERRETMGGQSDRDSENSTTIPLEIDIAMESEQEETEAVYDIDFIVVLVTRPTALAQTPPLLENSLQKSGEGR